MNNYSKLIDILLECADNIESFNEDVSVDSVGNFVSDIDKGYESKGKLNLWDFDFKEVTPSMYKTIEKQSIVNIDYFKNAYTVSWWDKKNLVAIVSDFDDANGDRWLNYIEVTKPYRGYGLSKQVLDFAVKKLKCVMLGVAKSNKVAIKVYKDYGFKIIGDNPDNKNQYLMKYKK